MEQIVNSSIFNEYIDDFYDEYYYSVKRGIYTPSTIELSKKKISKKYEIWIDKLESLEPKEYTTDSIERISRSELSELAYTIVIKVFGDNISKDFEDYLETIEINNSNSLLDGLNLRQVEKDSGNVIKEIVYLPNIEYLSSIVSMLHEFAHYFCNKYNINFNKRKYYFEILSLYIEKYSIYYLSTISKDSDFAKKVESTRLHNVVWQNKGKYRDLNLVFNRFDRLRNRNSEYYEELKKEYSKHYQTSEGRKLILAYEQCLAHSYGIGYLFGNALYRKCLEDENLMRKKTTEFMIGNKSIEDLLNYYNISLENFSIYDQSYNDVKKLLK